MFRNVCADMETWKNRLPPEWECISAGEYKSTPRLSPPVNIILRAYCRNEGALSAISAAADFQLEATQIMDSLLDLSKRSEVVWCQVRCQDEIELPVLVFEAPFISLLAELGAKLEIVRTT